MGLGFEVLQVLGVLVFDTLLLSLHLGLAVLLEGVELHLEHLVSLLFGFKAVLPHLPGIFELVQGAEVGVQGLHLILFGSHHVLVLAIHLIYLALEVLFEHFVDLARVGLEVCEPLLVLDDLLELALVLLL